MSATKLAELVAATGHHSLLAFVRDYINDPLVPGICCNEQNLTCNFITDVKPTENGHCENCRRRTVVSFLRLLEIV